MPAFKNMNLFRPQTSSFVPQTEEDKNKPKPPKIEIQSIDNFGNVLIKSNMELSISKYTAEELNKIINDFLDIQVIKFDDGE